MKKFLLLVFITSLVHSQNNLSLESAIEIGLENSEEIKISVNNSLIVKNLNSLGSAGLLPTIGISSGYNGSINETQLELNSFLDFGGDSDNDIEASKAKSSNLNSSIGLNYRLFNGFSGIYTLSKFKYENNIAEQNIRYQIETKIIEIIQSYFTHLNNQNIVSVLQTRYDISLDRYNQSNEKYQYGGISKLNLLNSEVELNQNKLNLKDAKTALNNSNANLNKVLGTSFKKIEIDHNFNFNNNLEIEKLISDTKKNNSSILISKLNYKVSEYELKISKSSFSPKIDLFTSYSYTNTQSETSFVSKQSNYGLIAGINIDIPIFSANMRRKAFKNAKINLETKKLTQKEIQKSILTALNTAYNNYVSSLENIQLLEENLKTIEKTAEISRELYDSGQLSNLEYRESQVLLDQAEINYSSKLSATKIQEYILYQLSGQLQKN